MKAVNIRITGKVQGVAFRYHAKEMAHLHHVSGWIRNRIDGSVEAFFQGEPSQVTQLINWCRSGSPDATISHISIDDVPPDSQISGFIVRPTC